MLFVESECLLRHPEIGIPYLLILNWIFLSLRAVVLSRLKGICHNIYPAVMDDKVNAKLVTVTAAFGRLNRNVWNHSGISEAIEIKSYRSYHPPLWLWNMNYLSMAYEEAKPLPHDLSEEDSRIHMAKTHPQHQSFNSGFSSQHLHHLDATTSLLGWSFCPHEGSQPPKETALLQIVSMQVLPWRPENHFEDTLNVSMKSFGITNNSLQYLAQDRDKWSEVIKCGLKACETRGKAATVQHRKFKTDSYISLYCHHSLYLLSKTLPRTDWPY